MQDATIVDLYVKLGDKVKKGDAIFEVETDKASMEVESTADGFVKHILVEIGQTLFVGDPVLVLGDKDEKIPQGFVDSLRVRLSVPSDAKAPRPAQSDRPITAEPFEPDTPLAPAPEIKLGATIPLNRLQKITAQRMLQSKREIPCFYLTVRVDVTDLVELRNKFNKTSDVEISYNDFIMRALAIGMEKFPIMTGRLEGQTIRLADSINIGVAISLADNVIAAVVKDVQKKDVTQIARDTTALFEKARNNKLELTDLEGACITVSNLGAFGIDTFIPVVIPGQCSILGVGRITDTCVPENGGAAVRKLMNITLSVDHKVANGAYATQFLDFVRKLLEDASGFTR